MLTWWDDKYITEACKGIIITENQNQAYILGLKQRYETGNVMFFPFIIKSITLAVNYMWRETVCISSLTKAVSYKQQTKSLRQKHTQQRKEGIAKTQDFELYNIKHLLTLDSDWPYWHS